MLSAARMAAATGVRAEEGQADFRGRRSPRGRWVIDLAELADADDSLFVSVQSGGSKRSQIRKKKSQKATILPLAALGAMLVVCVVAIAVVMSRPPETHVSQAAKHSVKPARPRTQAPATSRADRESRHRPQPVRPVRIGRRQRCRKACKAAGNRHRPRSLRQ